MTTHNSAGQRLALSGRLAQRMARMVRRDDMPQVSGTVRPVRVQLYPK